MATALSPADVLSTDFLDEEVPMTLQIGLVGKDGIVLASDKCMNELSRVRRSSLTSKIRHMENHGVAYAFAGDDCAVLVGQELEKWILRGNELRNDTKATLERVGNAVFRQEKRRIGARGTWTETDRRLTVVLYANPLELWQLSIRKNSIARRYENKVIAGDEKNSAVFFSEQYYDSSKTVAELLLLATHVMSMGHERNKDAVQGLEIFVVRHTPDGFTEVGLVPENELEVLSNTSKALDTMIRSCLYA